MPITTRPVNRQTLGHTSPCDKLKERLEDLRRVKDGRILVVKKPDGEKTETLLVRNRIIFIRTLANGQVIVKKKKKGGGIL